MNGVIYVAYGHVARQEAKASIAALRKHNSLPVAVVSDKPMPTVHNIEWHEAGPGARWAKLNIDKLTPWQHTLYLDADTRPHTDVRAAFEILADGWDLVIVPSVSQGDDLLWHIGEDEREATYEELGCVPLQLQGGVFWFRKCEPVHSLFDAWRDEWERWRDQDQAALLRALARSPVKVWLFGRPWNGGQLIRHLFGRTRRG